MGPHRYAPLLKAQAKSTTAEALSDFYHVHRHLNCFFTLTGISAKPRVTEKFDNTHLPYGFSAHLFLGADQGSLPRPPGMRPPGPMGPQSNGSLQSQGSSTGVPSVSQGFRGPSPPAPGPSGPMAPGPARPGMQDCPPMPLYNWKHVFACSGTCALSSRQVRSCKACDETW